MPIHRRDIGIMKMARQTHDDDKINITTFK